MDKAQKTLEGATTLVLFKVSVRCASFPSTHLFLLVDF